MCTGVKGSKIEACRGGVRSRQGEEDASTPWGMEASDATWCKAVQSGVKPCKALHVYQAPSECTAAWAVGALYGCCVRLLCAVAVCAVCAYAVGVRTFAVGSKAGGAHIHEQHGCASSRSAPSLLRPVLSMCVGLQASSSCALGSSCLVCLLLPPLASSQDALERNAASLRAMPHLRPMPHTRAMVLIDALAHMLAHMLATS